MLRLHNGANLRTARLLDEAGIPVLSKPRDMPWGSRSTYVEDPDGNLLEFYRW